MLSLRAAASDARITDSGRNGRSSPGTARLSRIWKPRRLWRCTTLPRRLQDWATLRRAGRDCRAHRAGPDGSYSGSTGSDGSAGGEPGSRRHGRSVRLPYELWLHAALLRTAVCAADSSARSPSPRSSLADRRRRSARPAFSVDRVRYWRSIKRAAGLMPLLRNCDRRRHATCRASAWVHERPA